MYSLVLLFDYILALYKMLCFVGEIDNWECAVTLEPVSVNQKHFKSLIKIGLKGTIQSWNWRQMGNFALDTWILQNSSNTCQTPCLFFQQLLSAAMSKGLLLVSKIMVIFCAGVQLSRQRMYSVN